MAIFISIYKEMIIYAHITAYLNMFGASLYVHKLSSCLFNSIPRLHIRKIVLLPTQKIYIDVLFAKIYTKMQKHVYCPIITTEMLPLECP
jgi:hypothetical protein